MFGTHESKEKNKRLSLHHSKASLFDENIHVNHKTPINMKVTGKNDAFSFGFTTAGGSSIKVSDKALSKAKKLLSDELEETDNNEETSKIQTRINESDTKIPNAGFRMASDRRVNVTNGTLSSEETTKNMQNVIFPFGFKTASGNSIDISDEALLKVAQQFENDIEIQTNKPSMHLVNNGFHTARGQHVAVTKQAVQKTEMLLHEKTIGNTQNVMSSIGFNTAGGSSINVSETALAKAKQLFANDLEDTDKYKEMHVIEKQNNELGKQVHNIGFKTANGQCMNITEEALLKAKALFNEETLENFENSTLLTKSLQKRKIKDLDDDVPLKKQVPSNQFKKLRFSNEFEVQKTVHRDLMNNEEKENQAASSISVEVLISNKDDDKLINNIYNIDTNKEHNEMDDNCLISHEIVESTAALLADEKSSDTSEQWTSPEEIKENEDAVNLPSSPVIGGQFIPKKRKSVGGRRKNTNTLKNKEDKSVYTHGLKQLNDNYVIADQCIQKESELLIEKHESMNKEQKCNTSVINEFGDTQLMIDFINESANILEKRLEAALEQDRQIALKERNKTKPTISKLYFHRKTNRDNRVSWKDISKGSAPIPCTYEELIEQKLPPEILNITANSAMTYKFRCADFYGSNIVQNNVEGIQLEDGACLILDENGYVGMPEIKRSFLASPGVDPNLLPTGWVENHYRWIVWKLASMDRTKLASVILSRALTPARVMMELKYRYDREIDRSQRPALRKILEKDDVASKRMVLCVSSITEHDESDVINRSPNQLNTLSKKLMLTDGWYSVQASVDQAMIKNIISGKVKEGTKLMTYGSELLNCDQGCSPFEVPENVCLKLHTNSTRRARWDTKLGYVAPSGPMCIKLKCIYSNGGLIGKLKVLVARVYPILYHEKTSAGESIFRNARCEEKASIAYEKECRSVMEAFYAKAEEYFSTGKRKSSSNSDSIDLAAIEWDEDYEKLSKEEFVTKQEHDQLMNKCRMKEEKFRQKLESRLQESLPAPRQVTPLLKIRVIEEETNAILSIWSPTEEIIEILKEGNYISISNVVPSTKRGSELQLTASRNAIFNRINVSDIIYSLRTYTPLCDVNKPTFAPAYGEFDTVGIVASIGNKPYGMKNFEAVHFAYPSTNSQSSYLSVLFWHGIAFHGYAEILTVGSFVACSNLEWRRATSWNIQMAYCTERSIFTRNPRQKHLQQPFNDLKHLIMDNDAYIATCAAEISEEVQKKSMTRMSDQYTLDRSNFDKVSSNECGNCAFQELPGRSSMSNRTAKSVDIQKRLEKLQYYGEPSSLSPIVLNNSSKRVSLDFQSPTRSLDAKQTKAHISLNTKFSLNPR